MKSIFFSLLLVLNSFAADIMCIRNGNSYALLKGDGGFFAPSYPVATNLNDWSRPSSWPVASGYTTTTWQQPENNVVKMTVLADSTEGFIVSCSLSGRFYVDWYGDGSVVSNYATGSTAVYGYPSNVVKTFINQKVYTLGATNITALNIYQAFGNQTSSSQDSAFKGTVEIIGSSNITSIGTSYFDYCNLLESVSFVNVSNVQQYAFRYCPNLRSAYLPVVTNFDNNAFRYTRVQYPNFPKLISARDYAFADTDIDSFIAPNLISLGQYAFENSTLKSVNLPSLTTFSGSYTFNRCMYLKTAVFPSANFVNVQTFNLCQNLESASFDNVTNIMTSAFASCIRLKSLSIPKAQVIGDTAFNICTSLESITCTNVLYLGNSAFNQCNNLESISIPNVTNLQSQAFYFCTRLKDLNIMPKLQAVASDCFTYANLSGASMINLATNLPVQPNTTLRTFSWSGNPGWSQFQSWYNAGGSNSIASGWRFQ